MILRSSMEVTVKDNSDVVIVDKPFDILSTLDQTMDWGVKDLKVYDIWKKTQGEGIKIAVCDTGIDKRHPDLKGAVIKEYNSFDDSDDAHDYHSHGTHCAGIIAARNNKQGIVGVAPLASLYAVAVLDKYGRGSWESVAKGIIWSVDNGADIVSLSLGGSQGNQKLHDAVIYAYKHNVMVVCAAGNSGDEYDDNDVSYPAKYEEAIAVAAMNVKKKRTPWSSDGEEVEITAPGADIYSTIPDGKYARYSGTSMACPYISGVMALALAKHRQSGSNNTPLRTVEEMREHMARVATDAGKVGRDNHYGYGIVDPRKTVLT